MPGSASRPLRLGYKASAEQFAPVELLRYSLLAEELGFDSVAISDHFQPFRHTGGHAPSALPVARRARRAQRAHHDRHQRLHADVPLPAGRGRARVRDARLPRAGPRLPRASAPASRSTRCRRPASSGRAAASAWPAEGGGRADPAALERGARDVRGRLLQDPATPRSTTSPRHRADLGRGGRPEVVPLRRRGRGRLHHDHRQAARSSTPTP